MLCYANQLNQYTCSHTVHAGLFSVGEVDRLRIMRNWGCLLT